MMATKTLAVSPLIDIQSTKFAEWWSMHGEEQGQGPVAASYLVTNLKQGATSGYFQQQNPSALNHIGFFFGMYHGGVLEPSTDQLRPNVTTLARLDHKDARRGYHAGREFYFVDAEPQERRRTEQYLLAYLRESVTEMIENQSSDAVWFYTVSCLLGELSGQILPMSEHEQQVYQPQRQRVQQARQQRRHSQEHRTEPVHAHTLILQEA